MTTTTQDAITASYFEAVWNAWFERQTEAIEIPESAPGTKHIRVPVPAAEPPGRRWETVCGLRPTVVKWVQVRELTPRDWAVIVGYLEDFVWVHKFEAARAGDLAAAAKRETQVIARLTG